MFQKIDNEKGVALIAALMVLMILSLLGATAILTSSTDMKIATNEKMATQGQYAAEAGIEQALVMLNYSTTAGVIREPSPGPVWGSNYSDFDDWSPRIKRDIMDGANTFFSYSTTVSYKKVGSGSYINKVAFYNLTSRYASPAPARGGWPVYVITSVARIGNYQTQKNILELTKTSFRYKAKGGLTAGGGVEMSGNVNVDGKFYDKNGALLDPQPAGSDTGCKDETLAQPKPGVFANGSTTTGGSSGTTGGSGQPGAVVSADIPTSPWDAMGLNYDSSDTTYADTGYYFTTLFPTSTYPTTYTGGAPIGNNYYSSNVEVSALTGNGNGLLIVHNPLFFPGACADGIFDGTPAACAAANAPATLTKGGGNATFKGLIIADMVDLHGSGTVQISGGVISLTTIKTDGWTGTANINYSCQAIEQFAGGKINNKLNWRKE